MPVHRTSKLYLHSLAKNAANCMSDMNADNDARVFHFKDQERNETNEGTKSCIVHSDHYTTLPDRAYCCLDYKAKLFSAVILNVSTTTTTNSNNHNNKLSLTEKSAT